QAEAEGRPLAGIAFDRYRTVLCLDELLDDRQPKPGVDGFPASMFDLVDAVKDPAQLLGQITSADSSGSYSTRPYAPYRHLNVSEAVAH
ncbi:MAG TPA: hypothetical protein VFS96_05850, partial [Nitrolancea sp.]|nr:hypothetical protein [Nitrolancea sp.]